MFGFGRLFLVVTLLLVVSMDSRLRLSRPPRWLWRTGTEDIVGTDGYRRCCFKGGVFVKYTVFVVLLTVGLLNNHGHAMTGDKAGGEHKEAIAMAAVVTVHGDVAGGSDEKRLTEGFGDLHITTDASGKSDEKTLGDNGFIGLDAWQESIDRDAQRFDTIVNHAGLKGVLNYCRVNKVRVINKLNDALCKKRSQFWACFGYILGIDAKVFTKTDSLFIYKAIEHMGNLRNLSNDYNQKFLEFAIAVAENPEEALAPARFCDINRLNEKALEFVTRLILLKIFTMPTGFSYADRAPAYDKVSELGVAGYPLHTAVAFDNPYLVQFLLATKMSRPTDETTCGKNAQYFSQSKPMVNLLLKHGIPYDSLRRFQRGYDTYIDQPFGHWPREVILSFWPDYDKKLTTAPAPSCWSCCLQLCRGA